MDCRRVEVEEIAERYLRDDLSPADREAFEAHFFECERCFAELRALESVQSELQRIGDGVQPGVQEARSTPRLVWAAAAAAVALATAAAVWIFTREAGTGGRQTVETIPAPARPTVPGALGPEPRLAQLGRIDPPAFVPLTVRSAGDPRRRFDEAMAAYGSGRYAEAAAGLADVVRNDPSAANAQFFLGICSLMLDRTEDAIRAFQRSIDTGDPSYAGEAQFFLAKALVRKADLAGAERALDAVIRSDGSRTAEARALKSALADARR